MIIKEKYDIYEEPYNRYMVKITPYKNVYKFDYVDNLFDKTGYCFFTYENGYEDTNYKSISEKLFYNLFDENMKPGKVYQLTTSNVFGGNVISYKEVPSHWFYA